eukprot:m.425124 g.425124  ORF g.425124 m.425124 type:complete len:70 (+) comp20215_c3_seq49:1467-1676(+)
MLARTMDMPPTTNRQQPAPGPNMAMMKRARLQPTPTLQQQQRVNESVIECQITAVRCVQRDREQGVRFT